MTDTNPTAPADESPDEVCSAADALKRAQAEFEKAKAFYDKVCQQAAQRVKSARETSIGDMIDGTLDAVRRHPGAGLTIATLVGLFLGRLFRR